VLDIYPLAWPYSVRLSQPFFTGGGGRSSAHLAEAICLLWSRRRRGESRAGRTQRLEDFIRRHPSRKFDEGPAVRTKCGLVETPGVEPVSEDRQCTASTCIADRLDFAATHAHRRLRLAASPVWSRPQPLSTSRGPARCIAPHPPPRASGGETSRLKPRRASF